MIHVRKYSTKILALLLELGLYLDMKKGGGILYISSVWYSLSLNMCLTENFNKHEKP